MRRIKQGTIEGGKSYEVRELSVKQIRQLIEEAGAFGMDLDSLRAQAERVLPWGVNLSIADLEEMAPSEIEQVYNDFLEVNGSFFALARRLGLGRIGSSLREALIKDFLALFADSLSPATGMPGTTGGDSSSSPSTRTPASEGSA